MEEEVVGWSGGGRGGLEKRGEYREGRRIA